MADTSRILVNAFRVTVVDELIVVSYVIAMARVGIVIWRGTLFASLGIAFVITAPINLA